MRKMKYPVLLIAFLVITNSCEDALKLLPPDGLVKDEYWKTKEDVKATVMGAYQEFADMDDRLFYFGELRADLVEEDFNLDGNLRNILQSNLRPGNPWVNWQPFYSTINFCNAVIKYSPQVKKIDQTFSDFQYEAYRSEAIFMRSLAYFYLVRIFRDVPFILYPYDADDQNFYPEKTQSSVILDSLETQLNRILPTIPESYENNSETRGRATRGATYALLADIALWQFDYQGCLNYIESLEESDLYTLVPSSEWFRIFSVGNTLEGILEIQFDSRLGQNNSLYDITITRNNNITASTYLMELLSLELSDEIVRGAGTINSYNETIWKYIGRKPDGITQRSGAEANSCNWIIYRMADIVLMKAEALSQLGRYDEALAEINRIRERAFMPALSSYTETPKAFEDLILEERAKELAYEGKRWFDLLRMGRRNDYERKGKLIELIIQNAPATQKRILAAKLNDVNGWYFPIHSNETENNPNLEQNPYYQIYEED